MSDLPRAAFRANPKAAAIDLLHRLGANDSLIAASLMVPFWGQDTVFPGDRQSLPSDPWLRRDPVKDFTDLTWRQIIEEWRRANGQN